LRERQQRLRFCRHRRNVAGAGLKSCLIGLPVSQPAISVGVTKRLWEIGDIVDVLEAWEAASREGQSWLVTNTKNFSSRMTTQHSIPTTGPARRRSIQEFIDAWGVAGRLSPSKTANFLPKTIISTLRNKARSAGG
jgi:hypothetical protein